MFKGFPSIGQYRSVVSEMMHGYEEGEQPTVEFRGTVKLHGTNSGIGFSPKTRTQWVQSRNRIINKDPDNAGFARYIDDRTEKIMELFDLIVKHQPPKENEQICVFGEWCGKGIQTGVGISQLEKMFVVFNVAYFSKRDDDENNDVRWMDEECVNIFKSPEDRIFSIYDFPTWKITIDFTNPKDSQNQLVEITNEVERECPVAKHFGVSGIGEGVVWMGKTLFRGQPKVFRFKVKGEKHSVTNVKKLASISTEKLSSIKKFVEYAVTENRMEQAIDEVFTKKEVEPTMKDVRNFIAWLKNDVAKEESDTMIESEITMKDVVKPLSAVAVKWFKTQL